MKILHCIDYFDTHFFYRQNYYTEVLAKDKSNSVYILTSNQPFPHWGVKRKPYPSGIFRHKNAILIRCKTLWQYRDMLFFFYKKWIKHIKPDVVHIYEGMKYQTVKIASYCEKHRIPYVYDHEQRLLGLRFLGIMRSLLLSNRWITKSIKKASYVRATTVGGADYMKKYCHFNDEKRLSITSLAFDKTCNFIDLDARTIFRKKYNINENDIVIGTSGKYYFAKKIEILIKAFKNSTRKNLRLFILGTGVPEYISSIKDSIEHHPRITFIDKLLPQKELNCFFNALDYGIWTLPTISYFEALGTGLKVILPHGSATSHLICSKIIFYGKNSGIRNDINGIGDNDIVENELTAIFEKLEPYKRELTDDILKYEKEKIVQLLYSQYQNAITQVKPELKQPVQ